MIRKILNITLLVALAVLIGTGCLKKSSDQAAEEKTYLVDPNDVSTPSKPDAGGSADPCLQKGAVGAQALMLKGECAKVKPAVCGNNIQESGEACDDGVKNGTAASQCDTSCKKTIGGNGENLGDSKTLKIITQSMPDKSLGDKYSATIKATGGKNSKDYKWTVTGLSEEFEAQPNNNEVVIKSKGIVTKAGTHKPSVQVCLLSEPSNCATCPASVCSFSTKDSVTLTASRSSAAKIVCDSSNGSNCNTLTVASTENFFGFVNASGPKFLLNLYVSSYSPADKSFQWKLSVKDGSDVKEIPVEKASEQLQCNPLINAKKEVSATCNGKAASFPGGIFLMEPKHNDDQDGTYHKHYLMFGPEAYGKTYENVEIAVKNNTTGGEQKIIFDKIVLPTLQQITDAKEAKKLEQDKKNPCYGKTSISVPSMIANGEKVDGKVNEAMHSVSYKIKGKLSEEFEAAMPVVGGVPPYKIEAKNYGATIAKGDQSAWALPQTLDSEWEWKGTSEGLALTGGFNYTFKYGTNPNTGPISDSTEAVVTDQCGNSTTVWVSFDVGISDASGYKISSVKLLADFRTEWTDGDSKIKFELYNTAGQLVAQTAEESADGGDPTCFNKYFSLTVSPGHENDSIDTISKVRLGGIDNGSIDMTLYFKFLRLDVKDSSDNTIWYATAAGDFDHGDYDNDGSWEFDDITAFSKNPSNGSIWFYGEPLHHADEGGGGSCDEWKH